MPVLWVLRSGGGGEPRGVLPLSWKPAGIEDGVPKRSLVPLGAVDVVWPLLVFRRLVSGGAGVTSVLSCCWSLAGLFCPDWGVPLPLGGSPILCFLGGKGVNRNYVSIQCKPKGVPNFESKLTVIKRGARRSGRCGRGGRESIRFNTNRRESFYGGYCSGVEGVRSKVEKRVKRESEKDKWTGLY